MQTNGQSQTSNMPSGNTEVITLGGGCFWCLEAVYDQLRGVISVESGYSNGHVTKPTYSQVCDGNTGHTEVVRVTFDPSVVTFRELLEIFFTIHDPTTLNRQGADIGTQYRSGIYFHMPEQEKIAHEVINEMTQAKLWNKPIVTEVVPVSNYSVAEDYHQEYFTHNGRQPYCQVVVAPKVAKFRKHYFDKLKAAA